MMGRAFHEFCGDNFSPRSRGCKLKNVVQRVRHWVATRVCDNRDSGATPVAHAAIMPTRRSVLCVPLDSRQFWAGECRNP
jgi:hypothetical protein